MKVIVLGYQTWGYETLKSVISAGYDIPLVITHSESDHPYEAMWNDSVTQLATDNGIPVYTTRIADQGMIAAVKNAHPDVIVANNWRTWLPKEIYDHPPFGTINIHDGLLPHYSGFSPVLWALINGESHVGVTAHFMDEGLDTGPIIYQQSVPVTAEDTGASLFQKTVALISPLVQESLQTIAKAAHKNDIPTIKQDTQQGRYFHRRDAQESRLDFTWPAEVLERMVRALSDPYPNAYFTYRSDIYRVVKASVSQRRYGGYPGRITIADNGGVAIVSGPDSYRGLNCALIIHTVKDAEGTIVDAKKILLPQAGYVNEEK